MASLNELGGALVGGGAEVLDGDLAGLVEIVVQVQQIRVDLEIAVLAPSASSSLTQLSTLEEEEPPAL